LQELSRRKPLLKNRVAPEHADFRGSSPTRQPIGLGYDDLAPKARATMALNAGTRCEQKFNGGERRPSHIAAILSAMAFA
jgi:hypothetical protein